VTDIATNEDGTILRAIFSRLEELDYTFDCRTYFAYDLSVPQHRQRLFVVAFRQLSRPFDWPEPYTTKDSATLRSAISDLPPLRGGWNEPTPGYHGPLTPFQILLREGFEKDDPSLFDHVTRDVRKDDHTAFLMLTNKMRYYDLPVELRRYGADSFVDKYKRLAWDEPCRSITAHMGKDGYWYIHPDQHRSLSIREAARVQSFPDRFRFAGFRTSALRQIGEAVPPLVAEVLARKILDHLGPASRAAEGRASEQTKGRARIRHQLLRWYEHEANSAHPWRLEVGVWLNLLGELLFADRPNRSKANLFWGNCSRDWPTPKAFLRDKHRESHLRALRLSERLETLDQLAAYLDSHRSPSPKDLAALGVNERVLRRAMAITGYTDERPNEPALVRVARRLFEKSGVPETAVDNQIATAMLVGPDEGAFLYMAAIELGETVCTSARPACLLCPLAGQCSHYVRGEAGSVPAARVRMSRKVRTASSQVASAGTSSLTIRSSTLRLP
jgi:DNA (cytosine-5)-methyltransferase 1